MHRCWISTGIRGQVDINSRGGNRSLRRVISSIQESGRTSRVGIRRLVLAKSIFLHGCTHAKEADEISRMLAIHHFDNAVEITLKCVASQQGIAPDKRVFDFEELLRKIPNLPLKDQIRGLHESRNTVQHQGDIPSSETVTKYKGYTEDFLRNSIQNNFGVSLDDLSLVSLIRSPKLRRLVQEAESSFGNRKREGYLKTIELCDKALIEAVFRVGDIFSKAGMLTGYFTTTEFEKVIDDKYAEQYRGKEEFYRFVKDISKAMVELGSASTGMQFLGEHRTKFLRFRQIVSSIGETSSRGLKDKAWFSLDFVTSLILKWQEDGVL